MSARIRFNGRSCRGWHWWPRVYPGIAAHQYRSAVLGLKPTSLLVFGWWCWELIP